MNEVLAGMAHGGSPDNNSFHVFLQESGISDRIYEALENEDPAEAPMIVMNIMDQSVDFKFKTEPKSEAKSNLFREQGNDAFKRRNHYRKAFECYNKAIAYAPENSQAMRLAYGNRSALLYSAQQYVACINDINAVFAMGCDDNNLAQRLNLRRGECLKQAWKESALLESYEGTLPASFFKFTGRRHPEIKCASDVYVAVETEDGLPKIVATRDISVGKVIAIESPFISGIDAEIDYCVSCYYCQKQSLNLIPCKGCCVAMFCDDSCRRKCYVEYHDIECQIMESLRITYLKPGSYLTVRAVLKMRHLSKSWKELIQSSHNIGEDRLRNTSVSANFDGKHRFSLLSYRDPKKHFFYGERYNASLACGVVLLHLSKVPNFLPKERLERTAALKAMARIMISLFTSYPKVDILNGAKDVRGDYVAKNAEYSYGWFAFAGKLRHCCDSNLMAFGLKNNIALVTARPMKKGEEFTLSQTGHYFQEAGDRRTSRLFQLNQILCTCRVCKENWNCTNLRKVQLSPDQFEAYNHWISLMRSKNKNDEKIYKTTCQGLNKLDSVSGSKPHNDLMQEFRSLMALCQFLATNNMYISREDEDIEIVIPM